MSQGGFRKIEPMFKYKNVWVLTGLDPDFVISLNPVAGFVDVLTPASSWR
jgi:hypothetical protein